MPSYSALTRQLFVRNKVDPFYMVALKLLETTKFGLACLEDVSSRLQAIEASTDRICSEVRSAHGELQACITQTLEKQRSAVEQLAGSIQKYLRSAIDKLEAKLDEKSKFMVDQVVLGLWSQSERVIQCVSQICMIAIHSFLSFVKATSLQSFIHLSDR